MRVTSGTSDSDEIMVFAAAVAAISGYYLARYLTTILEMAWLTGTIGHLKAEV